MSRPSRVEINIPAARHNLHTTRSLTGHSKILAIVKADAYGHGLVQMAEGFADADAFGVVSTEEAVVLRESGVGHRVVLLEGFFEKNELEVIRGFRLEPVIHNHEQVEMLIESNMIVSTIWLKINTGMNRLGFDIREVEAVYAQLKPLAKKIVLMSHLANANFKDDLSVQKQILNFEKATYPYVDEKSLANSGGVIKWPSSHYQWVRPGLILYGVSPFVGLDGESFGFRPVMSVLSKLINVRMAKAGERVGYGGEFVCPEDMMIGVVAYGYADGYPRRIEGGPPVLVKNSRAKIISSSMDMIMIDLRGVEEPTVGDDVLLWGRGLPVETVSEALGTIPYELLCGVRRRSRHQELVI